MTCRYAGPNQPRVLPHRHEADCADPSTCCGCQPCELDHCRTCGKEHSANTCAACIADVRATLAAIVEMCGRIATEAEHAGVDSEAAMLAGPAADPEAWSHHRRSAIAGRLGPGWLEHADEAAHPLFTLGTWDMLGRELLGFEEGNERVTVTGSAAWLDAHLHQLAEHGDDFDIMRRELNACRSHIEAVLHDGEQVERSQVPCLDCGRRLVRTYGRLVADDGHICPRCRRTYDAGEYARAKADHLAAEQAERFVLVTDAALAVERSEWTLRDWQRRGIIAGACDLRTHRLIVWWPDVRATHRETQLRVWRHKAARVGYALHNDPATWHARDAGSCA